MPSKVFNTAKAKLLDGGLDLDTNDIRVALVMSNTTVDTENDGINFVSGFTTLDEMNGANYVRKALTSKAVTKNDTNDRGEFDAADLTWTALGAGTRSIVGALVFRHVSADSDSIPVAFLEFDSPVTADGSDFILSFNSGGIVQLT